MLGKRKHLGDAQVILGKKKQKLHSQTTKNALMQLNEIKPGLEFQVGLTMVTILVKDIKRTAQLNTPAA